MLLHIDADRLVELASKADVVLKVLPAIGDFVPAGSALVRVEGMPRHDIAAEVLRRITLDTERSLAQDLAYGPRLLVDICVRSLGEPFDPTTAVQAIDRIHDFLRRLSTRKFPTGEYRDETGTVRLVIRTLTWDDYVRLSLEEIRIGSRLLGSGDPAVAVLPRGPAATTPRKSDGHRSSVSSTSWIWRSVTARSWGRI